MKKKNKVTSFFERSAWLIISLSMFLFLGGAALLYMILG
jgi:hypothetical protein